MQFLRSKRGGRKVIIEGHVYHQQRPATNTRWSQWYCVRQKAGCKGRVKISADETDYVSVGDHSHYPNFGEAKAQQVLHSMKRKAHEEPHSTPSNLTQRVVGECDSETRIHLPQESSMKRSIQRQRRQHLPPPPASMDDLEEVPLEYRVVDGGNWLLHDSGPGNERVLLFGSKEAVREMSYSSLWFCDGTLKSSPRIAAQVYVIHYERNVNVLLGCFALMSNRTESSYGKVFEALTDAMPASRQDGPARFSMDFQLAAIEAFKNVFPRSSEALCFFHFSQSLWRRAQQSGLAAMYLREQNHDIRSQFHACALAFVPEDYVKQTFMKLREEVAEELDEVLDLLEDTYIIGRRRGRGRRPPRFPIHTWNVHERTLLGVPRTNNSAEAWNRRINTLIGKAHPNIYTFLEAMKKEEKYAAGQREAVTLGVSPPRKRRAYQDNDARLQRLAQRFETMSQEEGDHADPWSSGVLKYLRAVGHSARGLFY